MNTHSYWGYTEAAWENLPLQTRLKLTKQHIYERESAEMKMDCAKMSSLDCCEAAVPKCPYKGPKVKYEEVEKENNMNTSIQVAVNDDNTKRYLKDRLYVVTANKRVALRVKFGMADADSPRTLEDFFQRIKDGKYVVAKDDMKRRSYEPALYISWRDPAIEKDENGYEAANEKLKAAETATKDAIVVLDNEKGLAALQAFEATEIA